MTRLVGTSILCGLLLSCVSTQTPDASAESEVQRVSDEYWANRADAKSLSQYVTEDAVLMVPGLLDAVGQDAFSELAHQRATRSSNFKVHRREFHVAGDTAYELAWYGETVRAEGDSLRMQGRYVILWKRGADGRWRIHRNLLNFSDVGPDPKVVEP